MTFISGVCNLKCYSGTLTKWKHFDKFAYRRLFPERVRIAFFASDLVFLPPSKNMALNGGRFCTCLCHSALEIAPCFLLFTSIRHFAICWWQTGRFDQKLHTFRHQIHTKSFSSTPVNFSNFTCRVCKFDTWSFENPHVESAKPTWKALLNDMIMCSEIGYIFVSETQI